MEYKKQLIKFDTAKIINFSFIMFLVPLLVFTLLNIFVFGSKPPISGKIYIDIIIIVFLAAALIVIHEGIHALGFMLFGKASKKEIDFGVLIKHGMVYCTCKKPMPAKAYLMALILPIIITGIIPLILVTVWGNFLWILLFSIMVSGGAGDIIMYNKVRKLDPNQLIMDHPKAPAFYLVYEKGSEPDDFVEATEEIEAELEKEIKSSPFEGKNKKKNLGMKILKVLLFLSFSVIVMGIIGILLKL